MATVCVLIARPGNPRVIADRLTSRYSHLVFPNTIRALLAPRPPPHPQGRLLASGQFGENADVCVWDYESKKLLYRLSEHDFGIVDLAFSDDERLLASVGDVADKKIFVWDMATGYINATVPQEPMPTQQIAFGGMVKSESIRSVEPAVVSVVMAVSLSLWALIALLLLPGSH